VVSNFIVRALRGQPITIYGDGSQTRSFCYVDDLIEGVLKFMATPAEVTGPFNLGNPNEISILHLANIILDLTGSGSEIVFTPSLADDPKRRQPDITRAERNLNWQPKVSLREGLQRTIAYFEGFLSDNRSNS
jgi:UDP-glucuronate decarboxylase